MIKLFLSSCSSLWYLRSQRWHCPFFLFKSAQNHHCTEPLAAAGNSHTAVEGWTCWGSSSQGKNCSKPHENAFLGLMLMGGPQILQEFCLPCRLNLRPSRSLSMPIQPNKSFPVITQESSLEFAFLPNCIYLQGDPPVLTCCKMHLLCVRTIIYSYKWNKNIKKRKKKKARLILYCACLSHLTCNCFYWQFLLPSLE